MNNQREGRVRELTRVECLELLRSQPFLGRIGYVVEGIPVIVPVNFVVDGESVVFSSHKGSKLSWLNNHSRVAFQADHGRPRDRSGWSVLVQGPAEEVTDPGELEALQRSPLHSWAVPSAAHWVRISIDVISGRRLERDVRDVSSDAERDP